MTAQPATEYDQPGDPILRRSFITKPGDHVLLPPNIMEIPDRYVAFREQTGLTPADIVATTVCSLPLPVYPIDGFGGGRRWETMNPSFLSNPLAWLPNRAAYLYRIETPEGSDPEFETVEQWAARLGLELAASGLYDVATGGWVDVLDLYGLDVTDPATIERAGSWLAGMDDPVLDQIDLTDLMENVEQPDWAAELVERMGAPLMNARYAMLAHDVVELSEDMSNPTWYSDDDARGVAQMTSLMLSLAATELSELPGEAPAQLGFGSAEQLAASWQSLADAAEDYEGSSLDELVTTVIAPGAQTASKIADFYDPDYWQAVAWLTGEQRIPGVAYPDDPPALPEA